MIIVTRLDGTEFFINPHQIECIEVRPDTTLLMLSGKIHILRDEVDDVLSKIEAYHKRICPPVIQEQE
jgi:flagellar protein FlbD